MPAMTKHLTLKALGALLALAALTALAVTLLSHNAAEAAAPVGGSPLPLSQLTPAEAWETPTTAIPAVGADVTSHFTLFRDHPASGMPDDVATKMASPGHYGRNAELARAIDTPYGQGWVVPGDEYLCIVVPNAAGGYAEGCTTVDLARQDGLWLRLAGDGPSATALDTVLAPDGTTAQLGGGDRSATASQHAEGVTSAFVTPGSPTPTVVQNG
jgi:hypothetical protein